MSDSDLVDRLTAHRTLGSAPRSELEWLAAHGTVRHYAPGDSLAIKGQIPSVMIVMLTGRGAVWVDRGSGKRKFLEWQTGDVSGMLPYSRMGAPIGDPIIDQPSEILEVHRDHFPEMIRECPVITERLVHAMVDRVRHFASTDWQDDKMMSLGRLAAGLSHELNNPASAAARSASQLGDALAQSDAAANALAAASLTDAQLAEVEALRARVGSCDTTNALSPLTRADREEEISEWLMMHGADVDVAGPLTESDLTTEMLDSLARTLPVGAIDVALRWIATGHVARSLALDVERASTRVYDLVSAVKRFTYMDRPTIAEPSSIAGALADTVTVLAGKARSKSVSVTLDVPGDLPSVNIFGGELNQVWSNLLENALDFAPQSGQVMLAARGEGDKVVVQVIDDGPGIPPEHMSRIFDPFFTTKPVGQGTGLGLDIARRIVRRHDGQMEVHSRPGGGHTEFRVILPAVGANVP